MPRAFEKGKLVITSGISFTKTIFEKLTKYAKEHSVSKSRVVCFALEQFFRNESKRKTKREWTLPPKVKPKKRNVFKRTISL